MSEPEYTSSCSYCDGMLWLETGETINLLAIQKSLVKAFQQHGDAEFAEHAAALEMLTHKTIGAHGEWVDTA